MRIVVALGGNALLQRGQKPDADVQEANVLRAVRSLAPLAKQHELVVTHGNGPQVGVLALQSASDPHLTTPYPFDVLGAQTQGMIGYWLLQAMQNHLPGRQVAAIINQTLVEAADPAFADPTKFVGEMYTRDEAEHLAAERGWAVKPDGSGWRRVVGSPRPRQVVETPLIRLLLESGAVVVCAGGGGVPVVRDPEGHLHGVEAVVDKDLSSSVLAEAIDADMLLVLTDVSNVMRDFGTPAQAPVLHSTPEILRGIDFPSGSMGPKVDAVCRFVELTDGVAAIGALDDAAAIIRGEAGTIVTRTGQYDGVRSEVLGPEASGPAAIPVRGPDPKAESMTKERTPPGSIVVGVDGSAHADRALAWAVDQAALEGRALTVVHAASEGDLRTVGWAGVEGSALPDLLTTAREIVRDAVAVAEAAQPGLEVVGVARLGDPRQVLVGLSEAAHLLVVGSRGRGTFRSMLLGSVSVSVAKHAHCPVVVTRPGRQDPATDGVLVGADGAVESLPVIEFAFRQASLRGVPLTVLHASFDAAVALATARQTPLADDGADELRLLLSESVAGLSEKFPDVHVSLQLGCGLVDQCLTDESRAYDLIVVGRHPVDSLSKLLAGSISVAVLERADSPVAVVPEGEPTDPD